MVESPLYSPDKVCALIGLSEVTLWRMRQRGEFPRPVLIGGRKIAWPKHVVDAWLASLEGGASSVGNHNDNIAGERK